MANSPFHLAQLNIARMLAPLSDPLMSDFVAQLHNMNVIADASPGFVWRLQDDEGDATHIRAFDDDRILVNLSVWESVEVLSDYVYRSQHGGVMRDRRRWFERSNQPTFVLWWVPAGQMPTLAQAEDRLEHLRQQGATEYAFSFAKPFSPPAQECRSSH